MSTLALFMSMHLASAGAKALAAPLDPLAEWAPAATAERQTQEFRYPAATADDFVQFGELATAASDEFVDDFALLDHFAAVAAPPAAAAPVAIANHLGFGAWADEFVLPSVLPQPTYTTV
jgi:hypothetical protein